MPTGSQRPYTAGERARVKQGVGSMAALGRDAHRAQEMQDLPKIKRNLRAKAAFDTNRAATSPAAFDPYNGGRKNNMTATEALPRRTTTKVTPPAVTAGVDRITAGLDFFHPKNTNKGNY